MSMMSCSDTVAPFYFSIGGGRDLLTRIISVVVAVDYNILFHFRISLTDIVGRCGGLKR